MDTDMLSETGDPYGDKFIRCEPGFDYGECSAVESSGLSDSAYSSGSFGWSKSKRSKLSFSKPIKLTTQRLKPSKTPIHDQPTTPHSPPEYVILTAGLFRAEDPNDTRGNGKSANSFADNSFWDAVEGVYVEKFKPITDEFAEPSDNVQQPSKVTIHDQPTPPDPPRKAIGEDPNDTRGKGKSVQFPESKYILDKSQPVCFQAILAVLQHLWRCDTDDSHMKKSTTTNGTLPELEGRELHPKIESNNESHDIMSMIETLSSQLDQLTESQLDIILFRLAQRTDGLDEVIQGVSKSLGDGIKDLITSFEASMRGNYTAFGLINEHIDMISEQLSDMMAVLLKTQKTLESLVCVKHIVPQKYSVKDTRTAKNTTPKKGIIKDTSIFKHALPQKDSIKDIVTVENTLPQKDATEDTSISKAETTDQDLAKMLLLLIQKHQLKKDLESLVGDSGLLQDDSDGQLQCILDTLKNQKNHGGCGCMKNPERCDCLQKHRFTYILQDICDILGRFGPIGLVREPIRFAGAIAGTPIHAFGAVIGVVSAYPKEMGRFIGHVPYSGCLATWLQKVITGIHEVEYACTQSSEDNRVTDVTEYNGATEDQSLYSGSINHPEHISYPEHQRLRDGERFIGPRIHLVRNRINDERLADSRLYPECQSHPELNKLAEGKKVTFK